MRKNELKLALGDIQYVSVQYQYTACAAKCPLMVICVQAVYSNTCDKTAEVMSCLIQVACKSKALKE